MPDITNILLVGDSNVGKTSLVHYLKYDKPLQNPTTTVGVEFTTLHLAGNTFHVWDTEGLHTMSLIDLSRFKLIFVICDAADVSSAQPYVTYLLEKPRPMGCTTQTTLVANKCDATPAPDGYMGTSALLGTGIEALRHRILQSKLNDAADINC